MTRQIRLLILTGIAAGILWRVELELHGWAGLDWIGYFHWAIPASSALFLGWLLWFLPTSSKVKRIAFVLTAAIVGVIWFRVALFALVYRFNTGPSALIKVIALGDNTYAVYANTIDVVVPVTPLLLAGLLLAFRMKPKAGDLVVAILIYTLACPVSIAILAAVDHRGGADAIHTIKSGVIIPFLVIGLGILVPRRRKNQQPPADDVVNSTPETQSQA